MVALRFDHLPSPRTSRWQIPKEAVINLLKANGRNQSIVLKNSVSAETKGPR
jgi:hypothetical protein